MARGKTWVVLANLLFWQLGAGLSAYAPAAHGSATPVVETQAATPLDEAVPCHGSTGHAVVPSHPTPATVADAEPTASAPCCATHACQGDCLHSPALAAPVITFGQPLPDHPAVLGLREPLVEARVAEFFRPPI